MQIKYKDVILDVKKGTKVIDLLKKEVESAEIGIIACKFNNEIKSLNFEIEEDGEIE